MTLTAPTSICWVHPHSFLLIPHLTDTESDHQAGQVGHGTPFSSPQAFPSSGVAGMVSNFCLLFCPVQYSRPPLTPRFLYLFNTSLSTWFSVFLSVSFLVLVRPTFFLACALRSFSEHVLHLFLHDYTSLSILQFISCLLSWPSVVAHVSPPYTNAGPTTALHIFPVSFTGVVLSQHSTSSNLGTVLVGKNANPLEGSHKTQVDVSRHLQHSQDFTKDLDKATHHGAYLQQVISKPPAFSAVTCVCRLSQTDTSQYIVPFMKPNRNAFWSAHSHRRIPFMAIWQR